MTVQAATKKLDGSPLLYLVALIIFVLAGFGVHVGSLSELDEISFGWAFFTAATLL